MNLQIKNKRIVKYNFKPKEGYYKNVKFTLNRIKISSKKSTSEYDIPYYVTDNTKVKKIYKWEPKKKILHIIQDMHKWMLSNKKILKKYIK